MVNILSLSFLNASDVTRRLAERTRALRTAKNLSRDELAQRCGLSAGTLKRFEAGQPISLENFVRILQGLGRINDLAGVLEETPAVTIAQLEELEKGGRRKRPYRRRSAV